MKIQPSFKLIFFPTESKDRNLQLYESEARFVWIRSPSVSLDRYRGLVYLKTQFPLKHLFRINFLFDGPLLLA